MPFDEESEEPLTTPDTENATIFHATEAPEGRREYYKRLNGYNTGIYNGYWTDQTKIRRLDNLAIYDAVSSQLELTNHQKRIGRDMFDSLNLRKIGSQVPVVALCVASIACRPDRRIYHPYRRDESNDPLFVDFVDNLDERTSEVASCYDRVAGAVL